MSTKQKIGVSIAIVGISENESAWSVRLFQNGQASYLEGLTGNDLAVTAQEIAAAITGQLDQPTTLVLDFDGMANELKTAFIDGTPGHGLLWIKHSEIPASAAASIDGANKATHQHAENFAKKILHARANAAAQSLIDERQTGAIQDGKKEEVAPADVDVAEKASGEPEIQVGTGKVTGKAMYKVRGFEMPWCGSEKDAWSVHDRLKKAYESGYYTKTSEPKKARPS